MKVKKYLVKNISEAMEKIRIEFGEDAYILETKKIKKGGFLGIGGEIFLEVTVLSEKSEEKTNFNNTQKDEFVKNDVYNLSDMVERNRRMNERIEKTKNKQNNFDNEVKNDKSNFNNQDDILDFIKSQREISKKIDKSANEFYENKNVNNKEMINYSDSNENKTYEKNENNKNNNNDIKELKNMISQINKKMDNSNQYFNDLKESLKSNDFCNSLIEDYLERINTKDIDENWKENIHLREKFYEYLISLNNESIKELKGKIMFVGPTGVGKTTTLAKIAAILKKKNMSIGIVTIDTYRIAAADQLKIYADIMGIPAYVCYTPNDLKLTLDSMKDKDVILIDTAGRSHKNDLQIGELKVFIDTVKPDIKILLLNSNTRIKDLIDINEKFSIANPNALILTKLDETSCFGQIYSMLKISKLPIQYITDGQKVPDDIKPFVSKDYASELVKEVFK